MGSSVHSHGRPSPRHETRDASIRGLVIFGLSLFVSLVLVLVIAARLFWHFARVQSLGPPASPFANVRVLPPTPRLQPDPRRDLQHFREAQQELLHTYGWVDRNAGIVHIPIDRAMDLLIQRGQAVVAPPGVGRLGPEGRQRVAHGVSQPWGGGQPPGVGRLGPEGRQRVAHGVSRGNRGQQSD